MLSHPVPEIRNFSNSSHLLFAHSISQAPEVHQWSTTYILHLCIAVLQIGVWYGPGCTTCERRVWSTYSLRVGPVHLYCGLIFVLRDSWTESTCDCYFLAAKVKEEVGDVDILINNAGVVTGKRLLECPDTMIQKTMEVNAMAHFWVCIENWADAKRIINDSLDDKTACNACNIQQEILQNTDTWTINQQQSNAQTFI